MPTPDASVCNMNGLLGSGPINTGSDVSKLELFECLNSFLCPFNQIWSYFLGSIIQSIAMVP